MNKIFFIIGASGAGKTTIVKSLEKKFFLNYTTQYFDTIGVPSFEDMCSLYNGPEEWQRIKTHEWVKQIKENFLVHLPVILDGQTRPKFIEEACHQQEILAYEIILLDCSDEKRRERLIKRGQAELADQSMMNWAQYLREQCQQKNYPIINNTQLTIGETLNHLLFYLQR